jgi:CheY-like chemotaxis protein
MANRPVLIIDDDPKIRGMVADILGIAGFKVVVAENGPCGIETARAVQPAVILLDMVMPDLGGLETCERLKRDPGLEDIPIVGITGSPDLSYTEKAFHAGAQLFLPKPFGGDSLVQVVELAMRSAPPQTAMKRRRHRRFPAEFPILCVARGDAGSSHEVKGHTKNVSLDGMLLWLPRPLEAGTVLRLCLDLPQGPVTADGSVMWRAPKSRADGNTSHGIRFLRFHADADLVQYRRFLSQFAGGKEINREGQ